MTDVARFKKKKSGLNLGPMGLNQAQDKVFCYFLDFGSLVFLEIAYNDSMEQFLETNRGKIYEQKLGSPNLDQTGQNHAQNQVFLPFSEVWFFSFPGNRKE